MGLERLQPLKPLYKSNARSPNIDRIRVHYEPITVTPQAELSLGASLVERRVRGRAWFIAPDL
jgi:hypothetical protein